ncbi:MAG: hypothetical protein BWY76_00132 [bacterium ADurb.Bin429]|nr:MAG: hypothetical protein BWY76_00132 [bacterium ADurb.Bin429]
MRHRCYAVWLLLLPLFAAFGAEPFRTQWDRPQPDALVFDAVHRSLLVRFPDAAAHIAAQLAKGYRLEKAELILPFKDTELLIGHAGYHQRLSFGAHELYQRLLPQWHAVGWALRKPWTAHKENGPTYNAYLNGAGYWATYGAQHTEKDRFPRQFGPVEVSAGAEPPKRTVADPNDPENKGVMDAARPKREPVHGRMDITDTLTDPLYGATPGARLRRLEECGFLLRKWEVYDWRFRESGQGAYEWAVATGGRGIIIRLPHLELTFVPARAETVTLPLPTDLTALAGKLAGGAPTAVLPDAQGLRAILERLTQRKPAWMPDWQWARVRELQAHGGFGVPDTPEAYNKWLDEMLADPPRYWNGWDVPDRLLLWYMYADAMPEPVRQHWRIYWDAWIMPDRKTSEFAHPQAVELHYKGRNKYYEETGDWRGNASFYRDGYCYGMSTMNFNHTAAMGALLGGNIVGSEYAMADGRHGLEHFPLRLWAWYDGSTQESIDHYYFAITVSDQKVFADFGPTHFDRMMGRSMLAKSMEELTTAYHPGLRRFLSTSSRTTLGHVFLTQEGLQHVMHTLSRQGALHDTTEREVHGMEVFGHNVPPARVAQQTMTGPWAPEWVSHIVDDKPLPFQMTAAYKQWGHYAKNPLWKRTFLGRHYGIGTQDICGSPTPVMAYWRREDKPVERLVECVSLLARPGINTTNLITTDGGGLDPQGGLGTLHHRNKVLMITSPFKQNSHEKINSLQTTLGLFNFQPKPTWEIYLDGARVTQFPATAKQSQRIIIKDGVSYLAVIPIPATDLGRIDEVRLTIDNPKAKLDVKHDTELAPALLIESFNLRRPPVTNEKPGDDPEEAIFGDIAPLPEGHYEIKERVEKFWVGHDQAYGGFVLEFSDISEFPTLAAFQRHIAAATLDVRFAKDTNEVTVTYASGGETLEAGFDTVRHRFTKRAVNGAWPYLPEGLERDSNLTQQGRTGRLEKNGAVLTHEPGRMAYLQTEPITGTYAGFNPLPDAQRWALEAPGGVKACADGRLGLARIILRPKENRLWVDYATKPEQNSADMATALVVFGLNGRPTVERNGIRVTDAVAMTVDGKPAWVIPLTEKMTQEALAAVPARYVRAQ